MSLTPPADPPAAGPPATNPPVATDPQPGDPPAAQRGAPHRGGGRQLSLFGVEAVEPSPADLAGLLAGPGQVVRMGGTARVSVVVDAAWRVHVLVAELGRRGLSTTWATTADGRLGVQTAYASTLAPLAASWLRETVKRPPDGFHLDGPRMRLWAAAAGSTEPPLGFLLRLGPSDDGCWEAVGSALAAAGLPAALLAPGAGGPAYRIAGRRRLARLAELVGDRPPATPREQWPSR